MVYEVVFAADARRDFTLIFEFLVDSYVGFGDDTETAILRAEARVQAIREDITQLGQLPYRVTLHNDILPGLRHLTIGQAIAWFDIDEDVNVFVCSPSFLAARIISAECLRDCLVSSAMAASEWFSPSDPAQSAGAFGRFAPLGHLAVLAVCHSNSDSTLISFLTR